MKNTILKHIKEMNEIKKDYKEFIRFHTFNIKKDSWFNKHNGKITCCIIKPFKLDKEEKNINDITYVGFSFCSPKDQYWKKFGQLIAFNRCTNPNSPYLKINKGELKQVIFKEANRLGIYWLNDITEKDLV